MKGGSDGRARPDAKLLASLREAKADRHRRQAQLPLPEKVRLVVELQLLCLPLLERRRPLAPWERPWQLEP